MHQFYKKLYLGQSRRRILDLSRPVKLEIISKNFESLKKLRINSLHSFGHIYRRVILVMIPRNCNKEGKKIQLCTVNVREPNVRFGKPDEKASGHRSFGYQTFGPFTVNGSVFGRSV